MPDADTIVSHDPTRPSEEVGRFPRSNDAAIAVALEAAAEAGPDWWGSAALRASGLHAFADSIAGARGELADLLVREVGKPLTEARGEVDRSVAIVRFYAQAAWDPVGEVLPATAGPGSRLEVRRSPVGVVLAITPWNFPLAIPIWKAAPALAWGNRVILKPSRQAVAAAMLLGRLAAETLPAGVFQVVLADAARTEQLIADPSVGAVSFTGSVATGRHLAILAATHQTPIQCEMGGQNAVLVLDDADLDASAAMIAGAAMAFAGQKCTATRRVVVLDSVRDAFVERLSAAIGGLAVGDPRDPATIVGPVIDANARSTIEGAVRAAVNDGAARVLVAAGRPADGWFCAPTVLAVDDPYATIAQEEVFGPALSVLAAWNDDGAVAIANATRFGLSAAVYATDLDRATRVAGRLSAGLVRVNAPTTGVDFHAPFGGLGESSFGPREQGRAARELFTKTQTVTIVPPAQRQG